MKNVQVIDGALNSTFEIYQVSDEVFRIMFPDDSDIAFLDEVEERFKQIGYDDRIWDTVYKDRVDKKQVAGIHGTLHLTGSYGSKSSFPNRKESGVVKRRLTNP